MIYLKLFETHAEYQTYINGSDKVLPNVSYCEDNDDVHYNSRTDIIVYFASAKLAETTSNKNTGLHTNAFNTTISSHTFANGKGIIIFDGDVTSIGDYAFYNCGTITNITIPNSVTTIGRYAFYQCTGITSITIPNSVTTIGEMAFYYCNNLISVTIPDSVTSIGGTAFSGCRGLTSITIPNSVTSIGSSAFYQCSGLTSIIIGNGVTSIGYGTFAECTGLTSITIPNSVTSIAINAFNGCSSLTSIISLATTAPTIDSTTFGGVKTNGTLYVPTGSTGYDVWMGTGDYYLGKYNWTKVEQ